jgi:hypothetical protein
MHGLCKGVFQLELEHVQVQTLQYLFSATKLFDHTTLVFMSMRYLVGRTTSFPAHKCFLKLSCYCNVSSYYQHFLIWLNHN